MKYLRLVFFSITALFISSTHALAQSGSGSGSGGGIAPGSGGGSGSSGAIVNPLGSASITDFLMKIIDILLVFALPIIVFFIIYAGFMYVTARGEPGKIKNAHQALTWSIIGGVIILGAKLLFEVIEGTVNTL